jgi:uncharacterized protein YbgA (DUF1722 family)/uncharacterized protein YbbK (DUF523 family)
MNNEPTHKPSIRMGISSCILGEKVRFNGGHKRDRYLTDVFGKYVEWVSVCPEVEVGMGIPRPTVRLVQIEDRLHMISQKGKDYTEQMNRFTNTRTEVLASENLSGYILKSGSPSCGMERVRFYDADGVPRGRGGGLFAIGLMAKFPHLPIEDEGRLKDARIRENFVSRVFAYHRWMKLAETGLTRSGLVAFHQAHKYVLMAHNQEGARRLGRLVAQPHKHGPIEQLADAYFSEFMTVMKRTPSRRSHTNVLQHMAGYVSKLIDTADRNELTYMIDQYRTDRLPLIAPMIMLRHHVRKLDVAYLKDQVYLDPHPDELMLLNQL